MNGLILYFSGVGNTKLIAQAFKDEFKKKNCNIDMYSIEENIVFKSLTYDFLVLAFPKYFEYIPKNCLDYIKDNLCNSEKEIKTMLILTGKEDSNIYFYDLDNILKDKNLKVTLYKTIIMPDSYTLSRSYKNLNEGEIKYTINKSLEEVKELTLKFFNEENFKDEFPKYKSIIYKKFNKFKTKDLYKNSYKFSISDECDKCNLCVENCPSKNIENIANTIMFRDNCIMCCRCVNICPKNAILFKNKKNNQYQENIELVID